MIIIRLLNTYYHTMPNVVREIEVSELVHDKQAYIQEVVTR